MNDGLTIFKAPQGLGKITSHCLSTHLKQSDTLILEKRKHYTLIYIRKKTTKNTRYRNKSTVSIKEQEIPKLKGLKLSALSTSGKMKA